MAYSYVWRKQVCGIAVCDGSCVCSCVWHGTIMCGTWLICMCGGSGSVQKQFATVRMCVYVCDMTPCMYAHVCDMTPCVYAHVCDMTPCAYAHVCDMTHLCVVHRSFVCVPYLRTRQSLRFRVSALGVQDLGFMVQDFGLGSWGSGVRGVGFWVEV